MTTTVSVDLGHFQYPIYIHTNCLSKGYLETVPYKRALIVTNETIGPLYASQLERELSNNGFECSVCVLPDGEEHKNYQTLMQIYTHLLEEKFSRNSTIVALGGGVIGDMAGFAAATYQRGIDFIQVPTTLLACVDSSVGGKTGINHPLGKNMIGAFYQPRAVLINLNFLETLPKNEYRAGIAEIIKYGCIIDQDFFSWLEVNMQALLRRERDILAYAIQKSCELKAYVVAQDEKETSGIRALLNFGHTFGHAIEAVQKYKGLKHGEAVAVGMVIASQVSVMLGRLTKETSDRVIGLIQKAGLSIEMPGDVEIESFWQAMLLDKKNDQGKVKYILLNDIGEAELVSGLSQDQVNTALKPFFKRS